MTSAPPPPAGARKLATTSVTLFFSSLESSARVLHFADSFILIPALMRAASAASLLPESPLMKGEDDDAIASCRETRPLHEAIASSSSPFIKGLSGSKDAALAALIKAGIRMKESAKWRTLAELSSEEKKRVTEVVASFLAPAGGGGAEVIGALVGDIYTLGMEDAFTPLRDAREFATLLNSCGRMGKPGLGLSICVGDRSDSLREGMRLLSEYRAEINKSVQGILSDSGRVEIREDFAFVTGDDLVDEKLLGPVTSILASAPQFKDRVIVARTKSGDSELKISSRVGDSHNREVNLGVMMREAAEKMGGVGGGHMMAAGAKIPLSRGPDFAKTVLERAGV